MRSLEVVWAGERRDIQGVRKMADGRVEFTIDCGSLTIDDDKMKHGLLYKTENAAQLLSCFKWVGYLHDDTIW